MLAQEDGSSQWVCPKGSKEAKEEAWQEWEATLELFRLMFDDPEAWKTTFKASFQSMLSTRERMALPGGAKATRWTGGDATKQTVGAVDWNKGRTQPLYLVAEAKDLLVQLQDYPEGPSDEEE